MTTTNTCSRTSDNTNWRCTCAPTHTHTCTETLETDTFHPTEDHVTLCVKCSIRTGCIILKSMNGDEKPEVTHLHHTVTSQVCCGRVMTAPSIVSDYRHPHRKNCLQVSCCVCVGVIYDEHRLTPSGGFQQQQHIWPMLFIHRLLSLDFTWTVGCPK